MKRIFTSLLMVGLVGSAVAQDCTSGRYSQETFPLTQVISDIQYGSNINLALANEDLFLDIYQPIGDSEATRPLVLVAHGGSFVQGSKTGPDVVPLCNSLARRGYVVASISYRLGIQDLLIPANLDSIDGAEAVIRGFHDAKAAVRFFYRDVVENGNTYRVDTNNIYFGGASAGAFSALNVAYLDKDSEFPDFVDTSKANVDFGVEGNSGNAGYSSTIQGVFNIAGAIRDIAWIEAGDIPVLSLHGNQDATVPFGTDIISVLGTPLIEVDGSSSIHQRAENLGLDNCFKPHFGQGHVPHVAQPLYFDTLEVYVSNFLASLVCNEPAAFCSDVVVAIGDTLIINSVDELTGPLADLKVYPNPAVEQLTFDFGTNVNGYQIELRDQLGKIVHRTVGFSGSRFTLDRGSIAPGLYLARIMDESSSRTIKVILE